MESNLQRPTSPRRLELAQTEPKFVGTLAYVATCGAELALADWAAATRKRRLVVRRAQLPLRLEPHLEARTAEYMLSLSAAQRAANLSMAEADEELRGASHELADSAIVPRPAVVISSCRRHE